MHPFLRQLPNTVWHQEDIKNVSCNSYMLLDYKAGYCCGAENMPVCQTSTVLAISNNNNIIAVINGSQGNYVCVGLAIFS